MFFNTMRLTANTSDDNVLFLGKKINAVAADLRQRVA